LAQLVQFDQKETHRLISSKYGTKSALESLPLPADVLSDLSELDAATNERKIAETGENRAIGPGELLLGVPEAHIVNAAFSHPGPYGGRLHGPQRGAWCAGFEIETTVAEVAFHKRRFLSDGRIQGQHAFEYTDFLADFSGWFHTLPEDAERESCLLPDPIPQCYSTSQALANKLLFEGSNGIVYPSIRRYSGTCIACFRPALVFHPRRGQQYRLTVEACTDTIKFQAISPNLGSRVYGLSV
jgi:RES domain